MFVVPPRIGDGLPACATDPRCVASAAPAANTAAAAIPAVLSKVRRRVVRGARGDDRASSAETTPLADVSRSSTTSVAGPYSPDVGVDSLTVRKLVAGVLA